MKRHPDHFELSTHFIIAVLRAKDGQSGHGRRRFRAAGRSPQGIKALLIRYSLVFYFIIAYAFSWLAEMPLVLSEDGAGLLSYRSPLGLYATITIATFVGPFLSAFIMTGITEGRLGMSGLLCQLAQWRVSLKWYLFALIGLPAIMVLSVIFLPGALASFQGLAGLAPLPMLGLFVHIFFLGRTTGRRAWVARTCAAAPATAVWSVGRECDPRTQLGVLAPTPILDSSLEFSAHHSQHRYVCHCGDRIHDRHDLDLQQHERQLVYRCFLVHTSFDTVLAIVNRLFPVPIVNDYGSNVPVLIGLGLLALVLIAMTRGRLGYQSNLKAVPEPATAPT